MTTDLRRLATEALGNALLLFLAISAAITGVAAAAGLALLGPGAWADTVLLVLGLVALGVAYDNGPLSRIHLGPAVTGAALLGRRVSGGVAVKHWLAQAVGAVAAAAGLWQFVPWVMPAAGQSTALATAETIAFTSQDVVIVGFASVALISLPFIVAAISAALRGPSAVEHLAAPEAAVRSEAEQPVAPPLVDVVSGEAASELSVESDDDGGQRADEPAHQPKSVPAAVPAVTPELVREILTQMFTPVAEPALEPSTPVAARPATPTSPAPREPELNPIASTRLSPAASLFSAFEREEHMREFLDIPTRHDVSLRAGRAPEAGSGETESPESDSRHADGKRDRRAASPVGKDSKGTKPGPGENHGSLALVRSLPLQDKAHAEVKAKRRKGKGKADAKSPYTVTVTVTVGDARGKKK